MHSRSHGVLLFIVFYVEGRGGLVVVVVYRDGVWLLDHGDMFFVAE